ncbi:MAG: helicase-related protein, partial [Pyrobaculum sp.]
METPLELSLYALRAYLMSRYTPCVNPSHSRIDALSYQLDFVNLALRRYYEEGAIRLMLADDVGLGKTIMTGLLLKELMLRGHVKRALLVVPRFLKFQWIRELREKFDIECAEELSSNCVVVSIDWLKRHVEEVLRSGGWDVVVFDEAHNLTAPKGRRTTQRYEAASILASSVRNVLLLTATPHHGDQPDFIARLRLLDRGVDERNLRAAVREYVVRRLREDVRDETGIPDRHVAPPVSVALTPEERGFYRGVEEYVLYYYDMSKKRKPLALVAIVFQKRASSSLGAALKTLQRRVETLEAILAGKIAPAERPRKRADVYRIVASTDPEALRREIDKLRELIKLGKSIQRDSKVQKLLEVLTAHKADKAIVFTQYRDTMQYVADALRRAGYKVVTLHGGMDEEQRKAAEQQFRKEGQVLVATDAASEGLNLQIANDLINFDLPWNPSRLDQRIGRVHRYGQKKDVFVYNFVVEDTIDGKVYSVLLRKIEEIRRDLGKVFDYIGNAVDAKAFLQILTRVMEGAKPEDQIEKTVASKATLKDIEDLLTQDRIRIEKDPRCVNYLTGQDLHYVVTATLAQLDPNSYREDGACIKIRYVPAALQPYCRGVCTTDLAGFGIDTPCPEKITAEHPLVQAVFQYHLNKIGQSPYIEAEIERPCYALGTTWVFTAAAELKLPVDVEWREQTYKIEEVKVHFQREVDIAQCSGNVGLDLLTLPVYAAPSREQPPPLPGEAEEEAKTQLMEKIRS